VRVCTCVCVCVGDHYVYIRVYRTTAVIPPSRRGPINRTRAGYRTYMRMRYSTPRSVPAAPANTSDGRIAVSIPVHVLLLLLLNKRALVRAH